MTKIQLTQLVDLAGNHARQVMIDLGQDLMPCWLLVTRKGKVHIVGTPLPEHKDKPGLETVMREEMRKHDVVAYSLVVEAWVALAPKGWRPGDAHIAPADRPDRKEAVIAFATDGEQTEWRRWDIKREGNEVAALEPTAFEGEKQSWMTELLS